MTDVERRGRYLTPAPRRQLAWHRWGLSFLGAVTVASLSTAALGTGAGASPISSDQAKAKQLYGQIQTMNNRVDLLGQRYDLAQIKLHRISNEIKDTARDRRRHRAPRLQGRRPASPGRGLRLRHQRRRGGQQPPLRHPRVELRGDQRLQPAGPGQHRLDSGGAQELQDPPDPGALAAQRRGPRRGRSGRDRGQGVPRGPGDPGGAQPRARPGQGGYRELHSGPGGRGGAARRGTAPRVAPRARGHGAAAGFASEHRHRRRAHLHWRSVRVGRGVAARRGLLGAGHARLRRGRDLLPALLGRHVRRHRARAPLGPAPRRPPLLRLRRRPARRDVPGAPRDDRSRRDGDPRSHHPAAPRLRLRRGRSAPRPRCRGSPPASTSGR